MKSIKIFIFFILSLSLAGCWSSDEDRVIEIGTEISEGIMQGMVGGMKVVDPSLEYEYEIHEEDSYTSLQRLVTTVSIESDMLRNPKLTFELLLKIDRYQNVVGTLYGIKIDGKKDRNFEVMENTKYVETQEGTEQVLKVSSKEEKYLGINGLIKTKVKGL